MQLKAVGRVPVCNLRLEICRQIDDVDRIKWAFFGADAAADAQAFRNECKFRLGRDFDAELACTNYWTRAFTFLSTFLDGVSSCVSFGWAVLDRPSACTVAGVSMSARARVRHEIRIHTLSLLTIAILREDQQARQPLQLDKERTE